MSRQALRRLLAAALCTTLAACASPREHLYSLERSPAASSGSVVPRATIVLGPVSIPAGVDRPQIVLRDDSQQLVVLEQQRWAAPLKESLPRLLAAELDRQRPDVRFVPLSSAAVAAPKARLAVDVAYFEVSRADGAVVAAHWIYRTGSADAPPLEGDAMARKPLTGTGYEAVVDALRGAVQQVAAEIAARLPP
jgi:uncharacterized lipoprotein YmbA